MTPHRSLQEALKNRREKRKRGRCSY